MIADEPLTPSDAVADGEQLPVDMLVDCHMANKALNKDLL
jgi:hypothetical protein